MTSRRLTFALGLVALTSASAWGQPTPPNRFTQPQPRPFTPGQTFPGSTVPGSTFPGRTIPGGSAPSNVNERHERSKTEAQTAYQKGDHQHALTLMNSVLAENPRDHVALYLRGSARVEIGRATKDAKAIRDGVADARQAISIKPQDNAIYYLPYLYGMTSLALIENRNEHAEVAVKVGEGVTGHPSVKAEDKANIYYQMGLAHMFLKDPAASAKDYEQALRVAPTHLGAHMALADAYSRAGDLPRAENAFDRAAGALPQNALVFNNRGSFRQKRGNIAGAIEDFSRAIQLDQTFHVAYTNRGFAQMNAGNLPAAEADFTASLGVNPNQDSVYSFRGAARLGQGNLNPAIEDFTKLVERAPKNAVAWSDLGFARFFAKDYKGALAAFDQAVGLNDTVKYLNPWRYWSMTLAGLPEKQVADFGEKIGARPKDKDWVDGLAAFATGNLGEEELLTWADTKNKKLQQEQICEAHYFHGLKLAHEGKQKEADEQFQKAIATGSRHLSSYRGAQFALKAFAPPAAKSP